MYFSSKKGKWYNRAVQMRPVYRYMITACILIVLLGGWRFGLYAHIEQQITNDRAAIAQMNKQLIQLAHAEKMCEGLSGQIPQLEQKIALYSNKCCLPGFCQMQVDTVIDEANKAGLHLTSYDKEQETTRDYCNCSDVQFGFTGSMDNLVRFFSALRQSQAMIECNAFSCQRGQDNNYASSCKLSFISMSRV